MYTGVSEDCASGRRSRRESRDRESKTIGEGPGKRVIDAGGAVARPLTSEWLPVGARCPESVRNR